MSQQFVAKVLKSEISMRPVLPLALPMDVGHVGTISDDGTFNHLGTIQTLLGLNSLGGELPVQRSPLRVAITSGKAVSTNFGIHVKTDGTLARFGRLSGKASISFGSGDSFFTAVDGLKIRQLAEPQLLLNAMLTAYDKGSWQKNWTFVHRIGVARHLTVILASESNTEVLLQASGKAAAAAAADVDLAAGFKFVASTKAVTQITGGRDITAFYDAYRVKDSLFSKPHIERYYLAAPFGADLDTYPATTTRVGTAARSFARA